MTKQPRADVTRAIDHVLQLAPKPTDAPAEAIAAMRRLFEAWGDVDGPRQLPRGVKVKAVDAGGVGAEWIIPKDAAPDRRIVHFHGGGMIAGSLTSHRAMLAHFAAFAGQAVLSVDYRRAPEHLFPAAHEDCARAFAWAGTNGPKGRAAARVLSVSGDSIGGGLAVSVCAEAIANGVRAPDALVLFGPTLEANVIAERAERACDRLLSNAALGSLALYAGATGTEDARISPLRLTDNALAHFPPTLVQAGAPEFLLYDSDLLARRLTALNRRVTLSIWPDMPHVWHHFTDVLPEAKAALAEAGAFVARVS